jgi:hypothetical protein
MSRNFRREILGCTGLLIRCHSIPLQSDRDYDLVALFGTLGFECGCPLFPTDVEFMILAATSIVGLVVLTLAS